MPKDIEKTEMKTENTGSKNTLNEQLEMLVEMNKNLVQTVNVLLKTQIEAKEGVKRMCLDSRLCDSFSKHKCNKKKEYKLRSEATASGWNYYPFNEDGQADFMLSGEKENGCFVVRYIEKAKSAPDVSGISIHGNAVIVEKYPITKKDDVRYLFDMAVAKLNATIGKRNNFYIKA